MHNNSSRMISVVITDESTERIGIGAIYDYKLAKMRDISLLNKNKT